jgi:hypothetical protein
VETRDLRIAIPYFILKELQMKCELRGSWLD